MSIRIIIAVCVCLSVTHADHVACPAGDTGYLPTYNQCFSGVTNTKDFTLVLLKQSSTYEYGLAANGVVPSALLQINPALTGGIPKPIFMTTQTAIPNTYSCPGTRVIIGCALTLDTRSLTVPIYQTHTCDINLFGGEFPIGTADSKDFLLKCWCDPGVDGCSFYQIQQQTVNSQVSLLDASSMSTVRVAVNQATSFRAVITYALTTKALYSQTFRGDITVCGAETFTATIPTTNNKIYNFQPSTIDLLTLASSTTAFTVSLTNSHSDCLLSDSQNLYLDSSGLSVFTHAQIWIDKTNVGNAHPIKVDLSLPFTAPVVFYFIQKSKSAISPPIQYSVMICGQETVQVNPSDVFENVFVIPAGTSITIPNANLNFFKATHDGSTASSWCPVNTYSIVTNPAMNVWTDPRITYSVAGITVQLTAPIPLTYLYLKASTLSGQAGYKPISILVCNGASITITDSSVFQYSSNSSSVAAFPAEMQSWYSMSSVTNPCSLEVVSITDAQGNSQSQPLFVDNSGPSVNQAGMKQIGVNRITQGYSFRIITIRTMVSMTGSTKNYQTVQKSINIAICGSENIVANSQQPINLFYSMPATGFLTYSANFQAGWFSVTNSGLNNQCGIQRNQMVQDLNSMALFVSNQVRLSSQQATVNNQDIVIDLTQPTQLVEFFLVVYTFSGKSANQKFTLQICGSALLSQLDEPEYIYTKTGVKVNKPVEYFKQFSQQCGFVFVGLRLKQGANITDYTQFDVTFNATPQQLLTIDTNIPKPERVFIAIAEDTLGNLLVRSFRLTICGSETITWSPEITKQPVFNFIKGRGDIFKAEIVRNLSTWASSSQIQCPLTFRLQRDTQTGASSGITFNQSTTELGVRTQSNLIETFVVIATSLGGIVSNLTITVVVCGDHQIVKPVYVPNEFAFSRWSGSSNVQFAINDLKSKFVSTDPNCPVKSFDLVDRLEPPQKLVNPDLVLTTSLSVRTDEPILYSVQLKVTTPGVELLHLLNIRICGDEQITLKKQSLVIEFDESSVSYRISKPTYFGFFKVDPIQCPIESYLLTFKMATPAVQMLTSNIYIDSDEGDLVVNLKSHYLQQNTKVQTVYLVAETGSKNKMGFKIDLQKNSCEFEKVFVKPGINITIEFTAKSDFILTDVVYKGAFETTKRNCPVVGFRLTEDQVIKQLVTNLNSMVQIDINNFVSFDFLALSRNVDDYYDFYIVGFNSKQIADLLPVRLIQKNQRKLTFLEMMELRRKAKNSASGQDILKMQASKVGFDNLCTITFNYPLYFSSLNESLLAFNKSTVQLHVFDVKHNVEYSLDWMPLEVTKDTLTLKLNIDQEIVTEIPDLMVQITILDQETILGKTNTGLPAYFTKDTKYAFARKTSLLKNNTASNGLKIASSLVKYSLQSFIVLQFAINFLLAVALQEILGSFHVLQIVCFQTMMNIEYPANAQLAANQIIDILNADMLNPGWFYDSIYDFEAFDLLSEETTLSSDYKGYRIVTQIQDMGFNSFNPISNAGGLYIIIMYVLLQYVLVFIIDKAFKYYLRNKNKDLLEGGDPHSEGRLQRIVDKVIHFIQNKNKRSRKSLIFETPLMVLHESIIQLNLCCLLFLKTPFTLLFNYSPHGFTLISSGMFAVLCAICLFAILILNLRILCQRQQVLRHPVVLRKYGFSYRELDTSKRMKSLWSLLFVVRRISVCLIYMFLYWQSCFQLMITVFMNTFFLIFIGKVQPYKQQRQNWKETVNEFLVLEITIIIFMFTDFIEKYEFQYDLAGWIYVSIFAIILIFNLYFVFQPVFWRIRLIYLKYYKRLRHQLALSPKAQQEVERKPTLKGIVSIFSDQNIRVDPFVNKQFRIEDVQQFLVEQERQMLLVFQTLFKLNRKNKMKKFVLDSLKQGFQLNKAQDLIEVETAKLIHVIVASVFFGTEFNKFVEVEYEKEIEYQKSIINKIRVSIDQFKNENMMRLNLLYTQRIQEYLQTQIVKQQVDTWTSFEHFKQDLNLNWLKANYLTADGKIDPNACQANPTRYSLFSIDYGTDLIWNQLQTLVTQSMFSKAQENCQITSWKYGNFMSEFKKEGHERFIHFASMAEIRVNHAKINDFYLLACSIADVEASLFKDEEWYLNAKLQALQNNENEPNLDLDVKLVDMLLNHEAADLIVKVE